jgi:hypothetical protein
MNGRLGLGVVVWLAAAPAFAQTPSGSAASAPSAPPATSAPLPAASPPGSGSAPEKPPSLCVERWPEGKPRPKLTEKAPAKATSGHAYAFEITIEHGAGETVLPGGFRFEAANEELKVLEASQFFLPDPTGAVAPVIERNVTKDPATTRVKLFLVPLPAKPGRNQLTLPSLPITIARASGEVMTVCTAPHEVTVEDPIANEPNPKPKPNPAPRSQLEEWTLAKQITYAVLIALAVGALSAFLIGRWLKRPKQVPPPPPPRPPWEIALEALHDLRHSGLARHERFAELYDRTSDILRVYLGDRYGFDGLESTTREALMSLRKMAVHMDTWVDIQGFMQDADLVKFAKSAPNEADCLAAIDRAEGIVARTRPTETEPFPKPSTEPEPVREET